MTQTRGATLQNCKTAKPADCIKRDILYCTYCVIPKTLAESYQTVMIGKFSVYKFKIVNTHISKVYFDYTTISVFGSRDVNTSGLNLTARRDFDENCHCFRLTGQKHWWALSNRASRNAHRAHKSRADELPLSTRAAKWARVTRKATLGTILRRHRARVPTLAPARVTGGRAHADREI